MLKIKLKKDINIIKDQEDKNYKKLFLIGIKINNYEDLALIHNKNFLSKIKYNMSVNIYNKLFELAYTYIDKIFSFNIDNNILSFLVIFKKDIDCEMEKNIHLWIKNLENFLLNHSIYVKSNKNNSSLLEFFPIITISYAYKEQNMYEKVVFGFEELNEKKEKIICANNLIDIRKKRTKTYLSVINKINHALENKGIINYFQPIIDNKTRKIVKFEALVRLKDADGTIYSPCYFLDIAKRAWIYERITLKVIKNSFDFLKKYRFPVSINISPSDIYRDFIKEEIFKLLYEFRNIKKESECLITFEILEDNVLFPNDLSSFINDIKKNGGSIAIDDFGSGYSNLNRIIDSQTDIIKIDSFLIKDIDKEQGKQDLLKSIVKFAKKRKKKIIAEFVASEEIYNTIKEIGIDCSQGYYFSPPLPEEKIKDLIK